MKKAIRVRLNKSAGYYVSQEEILKRLKFVEMPVGEYKFKTQEQPNKKRRKSAWNRRPISPDGTKACLDCKQMVPLSGFYLRKDLIRGKSYYDSRCNPCRKMELVARRLGLSTAEYRARMATTDGKCSICGSTCKPNLDHCHKTMEVRGILCSRCNSGLGQFGDSIERLRAAINYLESWLTPPR